MARAGATAQETQARNNASRQGRGLPPRTTNSVAARNCCRTAVRSFFDLAVDEGYLGKSPLDGTRQKALKNEPKNESPRFAIGPQQLDELLTEACSGGDDPVLDFVLLWSMAEMACRRESLLNLRVGDLLHHNQSVRLVEKNDHPDGQPVTAELLETLTALAQSRGSVAPDAPVCNPGCTVSVGGLVAL